MTPPLIHVVGSALTTLPNFQRGMRWQIHEQPGCMGRVPKHGMQLVNLFEMDAFGSELWLLTTCRKPPCQYVGFPTFWNPFANKWGTWMKQGRRGVSHTMRSDKKQSARSLGEAADFSPNSLWFLLTMSMLPDSIKQNNIKSVNGLMIKMWYFPRSSSQSRRRWY